MVKNYIRAGSLFLVLSSNVALGLSSFSATTASLLDATMVADLIKTVGLGANYRTLNSATPLGSVIGLDVGIEVATIAIPATVKTAMSSAGVTAGIPSYVPLPKFNIQKGLPLGIDIGFSYFSYSGYKLIGTGVKWAFLQGGAAKPAVAVQYSLAYSKLFFMQTRTHKVDVLISKKLGFVFDPYAGLGWEFGSGELDVPLEGPGGLSTSISAHQTFNAPHIFVGFPINLVVTKLSTEYDHSFSGVKTFGLKLSFVF